MHAYIIRRLLLVIPTVFLVTILVFFIIRLIPGDVIDQMVRERMFLSAEDRAILEQALGLDVPVLEQYGRWIGVVRDADGNFNGLLQGSLGDSLYKQTPVIDEIVGRLPVTVELGILSMLLLLIISIPIGVYSAIRQDSLADHVGRSFATLLITLPNFWVGIMIILLASLWLGLSPELKPISFIEHPMRNLGQFIVPAFILAMAGAGTNMRMVRSMMLEVLRQDYIRTAWAKGLKERVIIIRHTLKNALIPVVTTLGIMLSFMVGGTIVIERVFSLPGLGYLLVESTLRRDYTIVSGVILCFAGFMVLVNLAVDLTYGYLDPRIRYK
jgi:peptide/nickel transport system permease protein